MARFTYIEDASGKYGLMNLDLVRVIDQIEDGHCRIRLDNDFTIELGGKVADQFIARLLGESELLDGTLLADLAEKARADKKPGPKVQPIKSGDDPTQS